MFSSIYIWFPSSWNQICLRHCLLPSHLFFLLFFFFFDKQTFHIYVSHLINQDPNFPMKFGIKFLMFDEISYCILNEICSSNFMHGLWLISFWTPIFLLEQRVNSTYFYFLFLFFFNEMLEGDLIWEQKPNQFWCKAQIMLNLWIMVLSSRFCAFQLQIRDSECIFNFCLVALKMDKKERN